MVKNPNFEDKHRRGSGGRFAPKPSEQRAAAAPVHDVDLSGFAAGVNKENLRHNLARSETLVRQAVRGLRSAQGDEAADKLRHAEAILGGTLDACEVDGETTLPPETSEHMEAAVKHLGAAATGPENDAIREASMAEQSVMSALRTLRSSLR